MEKQAELVLDFKKSAGIISPLIYGHFAEHIGGVYYDGLWVGPDSPVENIHGFRKALVESFRKIHPPVLRWPGGCFAETYDWRDGIGPRESRPERLNWWYSCDGRTETNAVGTHEFMEFCRLTGAEPYVAANVTGTTARQHPEKGVEYAGAVPDDSGGRRILLRVPLRHHVRRSDRFQELQGAGRPYGPRTLHPHTASRGI